MAKSKLDSLEFALETEILKALSEKGRTTGSNKIKLGVGVLFNAVEARSHGSAGFYNKVLANLHRAGLIKLDKASDYNPEAELLPAGLVELNRTISGG